MPELLGWWVYVIGVPLSGGALLTLLSLGGRGKKHSHTGKHAPRALPKAARPTPVKSGAHAKVAPGKAVVTKAAPGKAAPGKPETRQTRAAELPPLFLLQNFLLLWSLLALVAVPFQPQRATPITLALILGTMVMASGALLAVCAKIFVRITPVDESSISHKSDLQGLVGECDATIDTGRGSLLVRDEFGTLHHLAARSNEPIARGEAVLLIEYQANDDYFQVRSWKD